MWKQFKEALFGQEAETDNIKQIKRNALVLVREIGQGGFSVVYEMKWKSPKGPINVAVKKLHRKDEHEIDVMGELDHPNIVKLIGVVDEEMDLMLVLELCEGGSLRSYLKARNGQRLPEKQFYEWAEQAARPLEYLRKRKLIHKDVKSDNYMITSNNILKLGDFGITKNIDDTVDNATERASRRWMAPELFVKGILSPKFDIFGLAVVLWEMWTGRLPWEELETQTVVYKVCLENERLPIPEDCSEPIKELLRQSWETNWKQRPDIIQVLEVITSAAAAAQETRQKQIVAGPWEKVREFGRQDGPGKLGMARHMTLSPNGDVIVAVTSASHIKVYSLEGEHKSSIATHDEPRQIAVSSDNTCFMTDFSKHITMYELSGRYKGSWASSCPDASSPAPRLRGLAIDHAGDLLLGDYNNKYIYRHKQDGAQVASIKVGIGPGFIAVTSQGTIVIASLTIAPHVVSNTGEVLLTLKHPEREFHWWIHNVYCHDGIIFVCNYHSILCYSESGNYLGSMPIPDLDRWGGIAMTSDSKTLVVSELKSVKVLTASPMQH